MYYLKITIKFQYITYLIILKFLYNSTALCYLILKLWCNIFIAYTISMWRPSDKNGVQEEGSYNTSA